MYFKKIIYILSILSLTFVVSNLEAMMRTTRLLGVRATSGLLNKVISTWPKPEDLVKNMEKLRQAAYNERVQADEHAFYKASSDALEASLVATLDDKEEAHKKYAAAEASYNSLKKLNNNDSQEDNLQAGFNALIFGRKHGLIEEHYTELKARKAATLNNQAESKRVLDATNQAFDTARESFHGSVDGIIKDMNREKDKPKNV